MEHINLVQVVLSHNIVETVYSSLDITVLYEPSQNVCTFSPAEATYCFREQTVVLEEG